MCGGNVVTISTLNYVQDNAGWGLGFGIPCIAMALALIIFLLGTKTYRFSCRNSEKNQLMRVIFVFVKAIRNNWKSTSQPQPQYDHETMPHPGSQQFKFLDKALLAPDDSKEEGEVSISDIEGAKSILRLIPIWTTCLVFAIVFAQVFTFFTKQGVTMDRSLPIGFKVPAAALQSVMGISILVFIPIYDRILVPVARDITGKQCGITMLQRIGTGLILSILCMGIASLVERKRLDIAQEYGLVDLPKETIPMSMGWLIPQYMIFGVAEALVMVGLQELFYDQVPSGLKSIGLSLYLSIFGVGNFLSSFLISVLQKATGEDGWFCNNLNRAHLDYFYWLLAGLSAVAFVAYLYFAKSFVYMRGTVL